MNSVSSEGAGEALRLLGFDDTPGNRDHFRVLMQCLDVYQDREGVYSGVWAQYGALANLQRAASKVDRVMKVWWFENDGPPAFHKDHFDDVVDCVNYLMFFMRLAMQGNVTGSPPSRPQLTADIDLDVSREDVEKMKQYIRDRYGSDAISFLEDNEREDRLSKPCTCDSAVMAENGGHATNCPRYRGHV